MSLQIADNFSYKGKKPLDARLVCNDIPDMLALPTSTIYDGIIVYVVVQKKFYTYDSNNTVDPTLQQWRELTTAGILIQSATIDNVTTSATKGHLILTMSDGTTIDCGNAKGDKGDKGDGFAIIKLYTSISDMTSDTTPVNDGQMVAIINSSSTPLTAKVYIRNSSQTQDASGNENGYTFFCNLADATVIQGPQGPQGPQGVKGDTPVVTTQAIAATSSTPSGTKIIFTTGTGSTAVSTSINVYNGKDGISVQSATINASGELVFTLSDASTINVGKIGGNGTGGCITMLGCFNTAPTTFAQNDIYYNNLDGLIYKSADGTTWGTGTTPEKDILYISMDDHKIYSYTNNTFEVYGGSDTKISKEPFNTLSLKSDGLYAEPKGLGAAYRKDTIIYDNPSLNTVATNDIIELSDDITNYDSLFICTGSDCNSADTRKIHEIRLNDVDYINDNQYKYGLDFCYNTTYYYSIRFKFIDSKHIKISSVIYGGWTGATLVQIVGIKYTTDVSQLVDSSKGIEDTPVGEIIRTLGNETPKHYLLCDGSTHNIADYPYLAQYFKDAFGAINVFGGDGTTTFAVPDYITEKKLNTSSIASNAWASSQYSSNYAASKAFNGIINTNSNYWQTTEPVTFPVEIGIDLGNEYYITRYALHNLGWNTIATYDRPNTWDFEGSNDKTNWNTIDTVTNYTWTSDTPEFKVSMPGSYRYYRLMIKTCVGTGVSGAKIAPILNQILLYYSNSNFTHIKAEPTYYMELNQAAYINEYCDYYDTNERIVGRWYNGKPVYRKVVPVTLPSGTGSTSTAHGISNMDTLVNYSLTWYDTLDGAWYDRFRLWEGSYGIAMEMNINGTNINIGSNKTNTINWTSRTSKAYATLEYTKTTDAPNSFDYGMIIDQFAQEALLDVAVTDAEVDTCFE